MIKEEITINARHGLTLRQILQLSQACSRYESRILARKGKKTANVKSILSMTQLNVSYGDKLELTIDGPDEEVAVQFLRLLSRNK